jgi:hypothetical protein
VKRVGVDKNDIVVGKKHFLVLDNELYLALFDVAKLAEIVLFNVVFLFSFEVEIFKRGQFFYVNDVQASVPKISFHRASFVKVLYYNSIITHFFVCVNQKFSFYTQKYYS